MTLLITPADSAFSKCIRERTNWTCEVCGRYHPIGTKRAGLHCSHWMGRGNWSTRFDPLNAFAHCWPCHKDMASNVPYFADWVAEQIGVDKAFEVRAMSKQPARGVRKLVPDIAKHYRRQHKLMEAIRADGWGGRIEFSPYPIDGDPYIPDGYRVAMREDV